MGVDLGEKSTRLARGLSEGEEFEGPAYRSTCTCRSPTSDGHCATLWMAPCRSRPARDR